LHHAHIILQLQGKCELVNQSLLAILTVESQLYLWIVFNLEIDISRYLNWIRLVFCQSELFCGKQFCRLFLNVAWVAVWVTNGPIIFYVLTIVILPMTLLNSYKKLNDELKRKGCITIAGRIDRKFFFEKFYGTHKNN
jgi:hypothetical protein